MSHLVELLNEFGGWLVHHLGRLSIELAVLAGVVLLVIRLLRVRSPRLRHLFWGLVLAKPVVTFLIASPISLYWFMRPPAPEPPPPAPVVEVRRPAATYERPVMPMRPRRRPAAARTDLPPPPPWWSALEPRGIAASAWLVVISVLTVRLAVGFAFVSFLRHTAAPLRAGPVRELVSRTAGEMGLRRHVRVAASATVHAPVLAGVLRPAILLPRHLIDSFSAEQLRYVIAHELAHVRRLDNAVLLVQRMAELLLFFHPVVWVCGWAMRREAEAACDDAVVAAYGHPAQYADSLTRVAETTRSVRSLITRRLLVNTFAAAESNFAGRVRRILKGRAGRMGVGLTVASVIALVLIACFGLPTAAEPEEKALAESGGKETKEESVSGKQDGLRYGFRHDPMRFVEEGETLEAALARKLAFEQHRAGDDEIISNRLAEVLGQQRPDGSFGETAKETGDGLYRLAALGLKADRPEVRSAFDAMIRQVRAGEIGGEGYEPEHGLVPVNGLRAACMAGCTDSPEVRRTLRWLADNPDVWTEQTCPWGATFALRALWHGREVEDVDAGLDAALRLVGADLNDAGCVSHWDPYAVVAAVGVIERPAARAILLRQLPMILRGQQDDGSWGDNPEDLPTLGVLRALKTHELLDELRELPPLPSDWRVVRSVPAPEGKLGTMTWLDGRLWVLNWEAGQITALSPDDGAVVRRLPLPEGGAAGIGRWGDSLAVTQGKPHKRLLNVNPETGAVEREVRLGFMEMIMSATEVNGSLWVADGWLFPGNVVDPDDPSTYAGADAYELPRLEPHLAGTCPNGFAVTPDGVWHTDYFARVMIKSAPDGTLMDWAERPFGWTSGIAYDGQHLWAIDNADGRVCVIEKTDSAPGVKSETVLGRPAGEAKVSPYRQKLLDLAEHDHHPRDSFSLTMQAAARALGKDVDYERIYALSTNAFAPDIRPDEECRITWRMRGRGQCLDLVADALGLEARPIHSSTDEAAPAPAVREALERGEVVVTDGGWQHDFVLWGVITDVGDDGTMVGVTPNGRAENTFDHHCSLWALGPTGEPMGEREADVAMLRRAVGRIRADADPFLPDSLVYGQPAVGRPAGPGAVLWGLPAMDRWIEQMEQVPYQQDDPASSVGNARLCAWHTLHGAEVAAGALRDVADRLDAARPQLRRAASSYGRIADLLRPAVTGEGGESYEEIVGDLEKQRVHAGVLREVKAELAAAADEMEAALRAEGVKVPASLQQDGGGREAVPGHDAGRSAPKLEGDGWTQETFSLSVAAVARSFGREASYEEICARSGQAFAPAIDFVNDCKDLLQCQGWLGHRCPMDMAVGSVGLEMEPLPLPTYEGDADDATGRETHYEACARTIEEALERGDMVITSGGWQFEEGAFVEPWWAGVVTEVREDGTVVGRHLSGGRGCVLANVNPGEVFALRPSEERPDRGEVHRRMLREAVMRIRSQGRYARGEYCVFGLDAVDEWIRVMRECEGFCPICQQKNGTGWRAAVMNAQAVTDRCTIAADYLRRIAPDSPRGAAGHLEAAAGHYERICSLLRPALTGEGGTHYRDFVGDLPKQRAYAERVLAVVKAELAAAADEMEAALRAEGIELQPAAAGTEGEVMTGDTTTQVVLDLPGMPEGLRDEALFERGCQYQAGVARAYVWALRQAGVDIDFTEFTALSGWAFSFVYRYGGTPQVGIRIRGTPGSQGPGETFQIADWFGLAYESVPTGDRERFWAFVKEQIDAGRPIISEQGDGGLIVGYREHDGQREVRFESFMGGRWMDVNAYGPFEVCALVPGGTALPKRELYLKGLQRAAYYATMPEWEGTPTGLAALDVYVADVADPARDFANQTEWFCWASRNRLDARVCAADWLGHAARELDSAALRSAASHYGDASRFYVRFHEALVDLTDSMVARERWDLAGAVPLLRQAVEAERAGVGQLTAALTELEVNPLPHVAGGARPRNVVREGDSVRSEAVGVTRPETGGLDYSQIDLEADHLTHDSFSLSVQAAAKLLGREVDYETVYALSTNCFAPGIRPDEPCKESWVLQARSRSIDLVARAVGLEWDYPPNTAELNDVPEAPDAPWGSPAVEAWLRQWHREPMVPHVRRLISEGKVIVSQGEWKTVPENIGLSWCAWGIITGATDEGEIVGASVNGKFDNPTDYIRDGHVLSAGERTLTGREADLAVLERAVHRIRGDADPYRPDKHFVFGLAAMDEWIAQMERPSFHPDTAADSHESREHAFSTALVVSSGAKASAAWLSGRAEEFEEGTAAHLKSVADRYDRITELLRPALTGEGGEHYREFIGDPEKQRADADLLRQVKSELAAAADEMEAALRAEGVEVTGSLQQDGGGAPADDIERLRQWANIFGGSPEKLLAGAERYPEVRELLELEASLEPLSEGARATRGYLRGLEPAEWDYVEQLEDALSAIAYGSAPADRGDRVRERLEYVEKRRQALLHWLSGTPLSDAEEAEDTDAESVRRIYGLLGAPDAEKRRLVQMVADKLGPDDVSREDLEELEESDALAPFAHRIDMHGYQLWSFDRNHELLLRSIGQGRAIGEWHEHGGPLAWGDGRPDDRPKVRAMLSRLEAWLEGAADAGLGGPEDYDEKVWLARCLGVYLRDHLANYYNWDRTEAMATKVRREDGETWIEGLERFPSWMTQPGGYVAASRYLGLDHSPAWLYGGSGFAFALNVHRVLCPSGPTAWQDQECNELAGGLGLQIEPVLAFRNNPGFAEKQEAGFEAVCAAIDQGLPVIGWEMKVPDYYVVCGYDEEGNYLFRDFDDGIGRIHHAKLGDTGIGVHYLMIVRPGEASGDAVTVRQALEFALEVAAGQHGHGGEYATGLAGYDRWIAALAEPDTVLADEVAGHGLAYNAACWAECRRHAAAFLAEARERLDRDDLEDDLAEAVGRYETVAARLAEVSELFPMDLAEGEAMDERLHDASRREKALEALRAARDAEVAGLQSLSRVAVGLGSDEQHVQDLRRAVASAGEALQNDGGGLDTAGAEAVVIEGAPTLTWGGLDTYTDDLMVTSALRVCLDQIGERHTKAFLAGTSGAAFETGWAAGTVHSGAGGAILAHPQHFEGGIENLARAVGRECTIVLRSDPERLWDVAVRSIDAGRPVVASEWRVDHFALLAGYDPGEMEFLGRRYAGRDEAPEEYVTIAPDELAFVVTFGAETPRSSPGDAALGALRFAVASAGTGKDTVARGQGGTSHGMVYGPAAYAEHASLVQKQLDPALDAYGLREHFLFWRLDALQLSRAYAVLYLREIAGLLDAPAREHLQQAAAAYSEVLRMLTSDNAPLDRLALSDGPVAVPRVAIVFGAASERLDNPLFWCDEGGRRPIRELLRTPEGRERFADWLLAVAEVEGRATRALAQAIGAQEP